MEKTLKLPDSFIEKCSKIAMEVVVTAINVNYEQGVQLLKRCRAQNECVKQC